MRHDQASTYAQAARLAFVLIGAGAVALAAFGNRALPRASPEPPPPPAPAMPEQPVAESAGAPIDTRAIAIRLESVGNRPKPVVKAEEHSAPPSEEAAAPTNGPGVRFLGTVREPKRLVAL